MAKYEHKKQPVREKEREREQHEVQEAGRDVRNRKRIICSAEKYTKIYKTNKPEFLKEINGTAVSCKYTAGAIQHQSP